MGVRDRASYFLLIKLVKLLTYLKYRLTFG
jgi:hypothetical protein